MSHLYNQKFTILWDKPTDDAAAATALAEHIIFKAPYGMLVTAVSYLPDDALTADNTNYAQLEVTRRDANGTNGAMVARRTTMIAGGGTGNWTAFNAVTVTLATPGVGGEPSASVKLVAGQTLTFQILKLGDGVVVPSGTLQIEYLKTSTPVID